MAMNHISILAGLAVIHYVECDFEATADNLTTAFNSWRNLEDVAAYYLEYYRWENSFTQTIIDYAKSHIARKQGKHSDANVYYSRALDPYSRTGRYTYWLGLGSIWFDILNSMIMRKGGSVIWERSQMRERGTYFPFAPNSSRPIFSC
jgi:hypothetical protein